MSETSKSILVYMTLLVGVGVIIFVVIQVVSKLQAPASIGGYWEFQLPDYELASCAALPDTTTKLTLEIQQSGTHLQMILPVDTNVLVFDGHIDGFTFEAKTSSEDQLVLHGDLDRQSQPHLVTVTLVGDDCLMPVSFMALRQEDRLTSDGGH